MNPILLHYFLDFTRPEVVGTVPPATWEYIIRSIADMTLAERQGRPHCQAFETLKNYASEASLYPPEHQLVYRFGMGGDLVSVEFGRP